jgi:oligoribonuclease NrnB/cAMP/cGMP phosphodiesterase (DHH superfamily)
VARHFLGNEGVTYIGWDYGDPLIPMPAEGTVYVLDLNPECLDAEILMTDVHDRIIWIDHHKTAIDKLPAVIPGYRIDGVAACRLAWQWFLALIAATPTHWALPAKEDFVERTVDEPLAVRLAGEYDIWDKRDERAETFQFGLRGEQTLDWEMMFCPDRSGAYIEGMLMVGGMLQRYQQRNDAAAVNHNSFPAWIEGVKCLCINSTMGNSLTFAAKDTPDSDHDALCKFYFTGEVWSFSLYHAKRRTDIDLSAIAKKFKGGGHRGACGWRCKGWKAVGTELVPLDPV